MDNCDPRQHHHGFRQVIHDIDHSDPPGFPVGADIDHDGRRDAVAQVDTDNYGVDGLEGQQPAGGERLQDTDGCGGTLQRERDARADDVAQERIVAQAGEQPVHDAGFLQHLHGAAHIQQAGEQDAEPDGDIADGPGIPEQPGHDEHDADNQRDRRQRGGLEKPQEGRNVAGGIEVQQADDLAGYGGADVRPDDDAQGLAHRQDARADQAGCNDDGGRGRLDQCRDRDAQDKRLERVVGHLFHDVLHGAGGVFLQGIAHQAHAVQEHGQAAQQGQDIKETHRASALFVRMQIPGAGQAGKRIKAHPHPL